MDADLGSIDSRSSRELPSPAPAVDGSVIVRQVTLQSQPGPAPAPEAPVRRRAAGRRATPPPAAPQRSPPRGHSNLLHYRSVVDIAGSVPHKTKVTPGTETGEGEDDSWEGGERECGGGESEMAKVAA